MIFINIATNIYVGLGSNLGDRAANISLATRMIRTSCIELESSNLYESTAKGFSSQPDFLNSVCRLSTELTPWLFMHRIKEIELDFQRFRPFPNAPRSIDIDILLWGTLAIDTKILTVPHPRIQERLFVLEPLVEISPALLHPVYKVTVNQMLLELRQTEDSDICWIYGGCSY